MHKICILGQDLLNYLIYEHFLIINQTTMKKLLCAFILVIAIGFAYGQKVKETPSSIATISSEDIEQIPRGSLSEILRSLQPVVSAGPSWATGKDSDFYWEYSFSPRVEIVAGAYREFIFNKDFNKNFLTRAGLLFKFGGTFEKWKEDIGGGQYYEEKYKINWGYIEIPAEIAYRFEVFGKNAFAGVGVAPSIKMYGNWKDEDGNKGKLDDIKGGNFFISPLAGIQLGDHSELDLRYDFGIVPFGDYDYDKKHHINSFLVSYIHKFY